VAAAPERRGAASQAPEGQGNVTVRHRPELAAFAAPQVAVFFCLGDCR
jgi:hypothetical protein